MPGSDRPKTRGSVDGALAYVMGEMSLVRPLGLAGIACAVVAPPTSPSRYSRFTRAVVSWEVFTSNLHELADLLLRSAAAQSEPPVLFYEDDLHLLFVSRYREPLAQGFRFAMPDSALVEDLVDKARFHTLAERVGLPVPASRLIRPSTDTGHEDLGLRFPVIVKPLMRRSSWDPIAGGSKALKVTTADALRDAWPRFADAGMDLLVQEMIPGPETCIESYHLYADRQGEIIGEFTGRKIRTYPVAFGHSTAVEISDAPDVAALGRDLVRKLALRGVAKFDFKRGPDGSLHLLEINPRYNLWHCLGALAGVNLPALAYADMVGLPRQPWRIARAGVRWCTLPSDFAAARASGVPFWRWLTWVIRCDAKSNMNWDDPMPLLTGAWNHLAKLRGRKLSRLVRPFAQEDV